MNSTPLDVADLNKAPEGEQTIFVWTEKTFYSLHLQNWNQSQTVVSHLKLFSWENGQILRWAKEGVDNLNQQNYQTKYILTTASMTY